MLSNISWQQYCLFLLIATILYYLFIWIVFFKAKLSFFPGISANQQFSLQGEDQPDEVMSNAQYILDEIRPLFKKKRNKNELIFSLQSKLSKYNHWDEPGFRETINVFILGESETKCSIHLSEEDLRVLWL